ncbi:MAG: hypothetical protein K0R27_3953 [Xanthobacteraceae bacterium]|jgi:hypothetical protein|nr:hypothetical protein [Xanthobacteraceae bacterium]
MLQELPPTPEPAANVLLENNLRTPTDVLNHPTLSVEAKRAVLASWASDRNAVPNFPGVRQLDNGSLVSLADLLQALRALDGPGEPSQEYNSGNLISLAERRRRRRPSPLTRWPHDDEPPPRPAAALFPPTYLRTNAMGTLIATEQARRHIV